MTDITETERLEAELRQAQRLEALGRLAGGIAHDFNNLLTVIIGYARRSSAAARRGDRARVERDRRAAGSARRADAQLLAFSRRQVLEPSALDPTTVARVAADAAAADRRAIELRDVAVRDADRDGRPGAARAGHDEPGGQRARRDAQGRRASRDRVARVDGGAVRLTVDGHGLGMDEPTCARIFEPFFTTKAQGKGTGLGLATVLGMLSRRRHDRRRVGARRRHDFESFPGPRGRWRPERHREQPAAPRAPRPSCCAKMIAISCRSPGTPGAATATP